jgi:hypothetical protein
MHPPTGFAIVYKCLLGAAALLGTYHAVSAASAAIAGVSNTNPIGPVTTNAVGKTGQSFSYRIIVTNPGANPGQAYWNAVPLPPGLTINTNIGGNGWITGTPTAAGVYPVLLSAGNANSDIVVYMNITITIQGTGTGASPPSITSDPASRMVVAGSTVTFSVTASGSGLTYQWMYNKGKIANATSSTLMLPTVTTNQSGLYSVLVSNSAGSTNSPDAQLLVVPPPGPSNEPLLAWYAIAPEQLGLSLDTLAGYRYIVQSSDTFQSGSWIEVTNIPPAFVGARLNLPLSNSAAAKRFYRVQVMGN